MIDGYTMVFDIVVEDVGPRVAVTYGKIYRYCSWSKVNECFASNETLAKELGVSEKTIRRHKELLVEKGWISRVQEIGNSDVVCCNHQAKIAMIKRPPYMGGDETHDTTMDKMSDPPVKNVQGTSDKMSDKDSIKDSIEDTNTITSDDVENFVGDYDGDPFDAVAVPMEELVQEYYADDTSPEPEYVDFGNEFGDQKHPKWKIASTDLQRRALDACGRTYFASQNERAQWNKIERSAIPYSPQVEDAVMHIEWIEEKIAFCEIDNLKAKKVRGTFKTKWTFDKLISMINNEERRQQWLSRKRFNNDK
jgi:hypothetical protein